MTRPIWARKGGLLLTFAFVVGVMASPADVASAALPSNGCGGEIVWSSAVNNKCTFIASGTRVSVQGAVTNPVYITYSLPPLVLPGSASVSVKVTRVIRKEIKVVVSCSSSGLAAAQCQKTSSTYVPRGTVLTCTVVASGVGRFDCGNVS